MRRRPDSNRMTITSGIARGCVAMCVVVGSASASPPPVQLHLPSHTCTAPCSLTATISITRDPDNRLLSLVWGYNDNQTRDWNLDAESDTVTFTAPIENLQAGTHTIYVVLLRQRGQHEQTFEEQQAVVVR